MAIVQTVNFSYFCRAFASVGRDDNFSYEAKQRLFEYLDNLSEDIGEDFEMDAIGICCEYIESTAEEMNEDYSMLIEKEEDEEEEDFQERLNEAVGEFIEKNSTLIMAKAGKFLYANF